MNEQSRQTSPEDSRNQQRAALEALLTRIRQKIFFQDAYECTLRAALIVFPCGALAIAFSQWQGLPFSPLMLALATVVITVLAAFSQAFINLRAQRATALAFDAEADLKDRVSSALNFLNRAEPSIPQRLQIDDALEQARRASAQKLFQLQAPRHSAGLTAVTLLLVASLFVPQSPTLDTAQAAIDPTKALQLDELKALTEDLTEEETDPEIEEALKELRELEEKFEKGELSDRDLMIELARLDERLREKNEQLGVQHLEEQLNTVLPHLMGSAATEPIAAAIKEKQLDQAAAELEKLAEQVQEDKLSEQDKKQLAMNFGAAAAKLGQPNNNSFAGEFSSASEALESSDTKGFCSACKSMGDKLSRLSKSRKLAKACNKIGECKACIGQCNSNIGGYVLGPKTKSNKKGGLRAGTGASGDPLAEASRLNESYRQLLQVTGQAGEGPVETETEITEGQLTASQVAVKDVHAEFAAVAEEAIENETIPLSHRFHVKRYFQTIRPKE